MEARLEAVARNEFGKNETRRLRAKGQIPAVLYGGVTGSPNPPAANIAVDPKVLSRILHSESGVNTLIGLKYGDEDVKVLVREYQLDPVSHDLLHVDFYRIAMDKKLTVTVPIVLKGEPKGVKQQGGLLDFVHREIQIECLPADIPASIKIDVSHLGLHANLRAAELKVGDKVKVLEPADRVVVHVVVPRAEEPAPTAAAAPAEGAAPAAAEPEVIKKGKKEEEGAAEAAPAKPAAEKGAKK